LISLTTFSLALYDGKKVFSNLEGIEPFIVIRSRESDFENVVKVERFEKELNGMKVTGFIVTLTEIIIQE